MGKFSKKEKPDKPHQGFISEWFKVGVGDATFIAGNFSRFDGRSGHTSRVLRIVCDQVETRNSWYTLLNRAGEHASTTIQ